MLIKKTLQEGTSEIEFPVDQTLSFTAKLYYCIQAPHYVPKYVLLRLGLFIFSRLMPPSLSGEWP